MTKHNKSTDHGTAKGTAKGTPRPNNDGILALVASYAKAKGRNLAVVSDLQGRVQMVDFDLFVESCIGKPRSRRELERSIEDRLDEIQPAKKTG